jgi:hypothetical protein
MHAKHADVSKLDDLSRLVIGCIRRAVFTGVWFE